MEYVRGGNVYIIRLDRGEEIMASLGDFCIRENIRTGMINGIGASDHAIIGLFDVNKKVFHKQEFNEAMEITSIAGNISRMNDEPYLHLHIDLAREDLSVIGGHLIESRISATCELHVHAYDMNVDRRQDTETGLNLYKL